MEQTAMAKLSNRINRYQANYQEEMNSAALYRAISTIESSSQLQAVYARMAREEDHRARIWARKLEGLGCEVPTDFPSWQTRVAIWLARRFGTNVILPKLPIKGMGHPQIPTDSAKGLGSQPHGSGESHARILHSIENSETEGIEGPALARLEGRHHAIGGNALRAAVLGANDGLVSNFSLIMGVIGAEFSESTIVTTGIAGLLAGAGSMAMGEWISVQSSRELSQRQIEIEKDELEEMPEEEEQELALIFEAKGLNKGDARNVASEIMSDQQKALDTHVREELGIDQEELGGTPGEAAVMSFGLFAVGAAVPLMPFTIFDGYDAVGWSLSASILALFLFGAAVTFLTGRGMWYSGFRQLSLGLAAAALTFGVGKLVTFL